mmetsp:Transcript_73206/g.89846  ORF Transcript_73206/g.89846 Transcript_73206/m.89846 type:complete len:303 (-) Transcript_73206:60-968(-)
MVDVEIKLDRYDRCYCPGDVVTGVVIVRSESRSSHSGIKLKVEGAVNLQLSARSVGLFEAFYSSIKPIELITYSINVSSSGKINKGETEYPFEFELKPKKNQKLFETYHGVYINVQYIITVEMLRSMLSKNINKSMEFIVKSKSKPFKKNKVSFEITPENLKNVQKQNTKNIPEFSIKGYFKSGVCNVQSPFVGEIIVEKAEQEIKSIELQFVRVETVIYADTEIREATEVQNIQIADGNVCHNLSIPIYMIFPRLFTCVTTSSKSFKVEFEVNVVVLFKDTHMLTENFPIKLVRQNTNKLF